MGSLILFSANYRATVDFYRELGLPLGSESHDSGPEHFACDIGDVHFAIFDVSDSTPASLPYRSGGSSYHGFRITDLNALVGRLRAAGRPIRQEADKFPWGARALVDDPDGRVVELFEPS